MSQILSIKYTIIETTKTTYCPKKLVTNSYLLPIRRTTKNIYII